LQDPSTNEIRYIGKSIHPKRRYSSHLRDNRNFHKCNWIKSLLSRGFAPNMVILAIVEEKEWEKAEQYFISIYKSLGSRLTNMTEGGDGNKGYKLSEEARHKIGIAGRGRTPW